MPGGQAGRQLRIRVCRGSEEQRRGVASRVALLRARCAPGAVRGVQVMPVLACCFVADGLNAVLGAVLRGAGRQWWTAGLNVAGWWGVGVPLAYYLAIVQVGCAGVGKGTLFLLLAARGNAYQQGRSRTCRVATVRALWWLTK